MAAAAEHVGRLRSGDELVRFACELDSAELLDRQDPKADQWVHVLPLGPEVTARDGRRFTVENAQDILSATELPMLVDWEHRSEGADTRAAGWVEELRIEPVEAGSRAGIWGRVRWTPQGREHVSTQHYRFLSPVVAGKRDPASLRLKVHRIAAVALTNRPALKLHGIEMFREQLSHRLGAFAPEDQEEPMDKLHKAVREAFGLSADATEDQMVETIASAKKKPGEGDSVREALSAVTQERNAALQKAEQLEQELLSFRGQAFDREVRAFFDDASRTGKVPPAAREKWQGFSLKSADNFETFKTVIFPDLPTLGTPQKGSKKTARREALSRKSEHGVDYEALRAAGFKDDEIKEAERAVFSAKPGPGDEEDEDDATDHDEGDTTDDGKEAGAGG